MPANTSQPDVRAESDRLRLRNDATRFGALQNMQVDFRNGWTASILATPESRGLEFAAWRTDMRDSNDLFSMAGWATWDNGTYVSGWRFVHEIAPFLAYVNSLDDSDEPVLVTEEGWFTS